MFRHIRTKILGVILPIVFILVFFFIFVSVKAGKNIVYDQIRERMKAEQQVEVVAIDSNLQRVKEASSYLNCHCRCI